MDLKALARLDIVAPVLQDKLIYYQQLSRVVSQTQDCQTSCAKDRAETFSLLYQTKASDEDQLVLDGESSERGPGCGHTISRVSIQTSSGVLGPDPCSPRQWPPLTSGAGTALYRVFPCEDLPRGQSSVHSS